MIDFGSIAKVEGLTTKNLEERYFSYFVSGKTEDPDRCIDDRPKAYFGSFYPFDKAATTYFGLQLPGATFGFIDSLRLVTKKSEAEARVFLKSVYDQNHWQIAIHIDDEQGQNRDPSLLKHRDLGCNDQEKKMTGAVPLFAALITREEVASRFTWARRVGSLPVLSSHHEAQSALVNLDPDLTFDTMRATSEKSPAYNLDLGAVEQRVAIFAQALGSEAGINFGEQMVSTIFQNYLQTLKACTGIKEIQIKN